MVSAAFDQHKDSRPSIADIVMRELAPHMAVEKRQVYAQMIAAVTGLFDGLPYTFEGKTQEHVSISTSKLSVVFRFIQFLRGVPTAAIDVDPMDAGTYRCKFQFDPQTFVEVTMMQEADENDSETLGITFATKEELETYLMYGESSVCIPSQIYKSDKLTPVQVQDTFLHFLQHVHSPYATHAYDRSRQMQRQGGTNDPNLNPRM